MRSHAAPSTIRRALDLFDREPVTTRAHVRVRVATCPFAALLARIPESGRVLDLGCGHGLLAAAAALGGDREVVATDVDDGKTATAGRVAERVRAAGGRLTVRTATPGEVPPGPWDAVTVVDVLYLLDLGEQRGLLRAVARELAPGGRLLVKEMGTEPRFKAGWNRAQEAVSVRLLRITRASNRHLHFVGPAELRRWMEEEGLAVEDVQLHAGRLHPHHLLVATRRGP